MVFCPWSSFILSSHSTQWRGLLRLTVPLSLLLSLGLALLLPQVCSQGDRPQSGENPTTLYCVRNWFFLRFFSCSLVHGFSLVQIRSYTSTVSLSLPFVSLQKASPPLPCLCCPQLYLSRFANTHLCPAELSQSSCGDYSVTPPTDFLGVLSVLTSIQLCLREEGNPGPPTSPPS